MRVKATCSGGCDQPPLREQDAPATLGNPARQRLHTGCKVPATPPQSVRKHPAEESPQPAKPKSGAKPFRPSASLSTMSDRRTAAFPGAAAGERGGGVPAGIFRHERRRRAPPRHRWLKYGKWLVLLCFAPRQPPASIAGAERRVRVFPAVNQVNVVNAVNKVTSRGGPTTR